MMKIQARIEGVEKLQALMKNLTAQVSRRVLRPALNAEGSKVVAQAKRLVPKVTGLFKKSLGKKTKTYVQSGNIIVVAGPRTGFKQVVAGKPRDPVKYGHLVEFGTRPHIVKVHQARLKSSGNRSFNQMHPGARAKRPLTNAYKYALVGAADRMAARMAIEIEKQAAKGGK